MKPAGIVLLFVASLVVAALLKLLLVPDLIYFWFFEVPILFSVSLSLALGFGKVSSPRESGYLLLYTGLLATLWNIFILLGLSVDSGWGILYGADILLPASLQLFLSVTAVVFIGNTFDLQMVDWRIGGNKVQQMALQALLIIGFSIGLAYFLVWLIP